MMKDNTLLVFLPLIGAILIMFCVFTGNPFNNVQKSNLLSLYESESCGDCPSFVLSADCANSDYPVLGGLDFVQYFTEFQNSDGTYDETKIGTAGISEYSSTYKGFTFLFKSADNKALFDEEPTKYIPQYGGYCAWGVSGELCPSKPWSASCLGPSGNWGQWTIQNGKLYFFLFDSAKELFMADVDEYSAQGDDRWSTWFPETDSYYSTQCYVAVTQDGTTTDTGTSIQTPLNNPF